MVALLPVGTRVRLRRDVARYPHFVAPAGATGTVSRRDDLYVEVTLDAYLRGAEEWENAVVWIAEDDAPEDDLDVIEAAQ